MPGDERSTTLIDLFDEQVRRTPDAVAVVGHEETLTYAELSVRVDGLAARLEVGKGALVAVHLDRSVRLVVAVYAVLRVGAAYVPLDPDYPDDRIAFMVADAGADVVITEKALLEQLPQVECRVITVDDGDLSQVMPPSGPRKSPAGPDDLAYVIYTSGSTGRPKGVMISHAAIVNRILWMQSEYGLSADDRVLHKTPFSFDVSVWELFWPLLCGASMVVARAGGHRDSAYLINLIKRERVTTVHFVPSMLRIFLEDPSVTACVGLRRVFCSGEALTRALQDRFFDLLDVPLHNLYGPTEAAVDVTYWPCERNSDLATVPIGYPVANTQIYLLDESGEPVSAGTVGRLFIGGVQVAVGYLGRPELTADRFVPDPFTDRPGARMYDSGDLARSLPNGAFDYVGRADGQVKLHGQRIELGEIESILDLHSGVGQSVVIVTWDDVGEGRLVAYWVVAGGGSSPTEDALREHRPRGSPATWSRKSSPARRHAARAERQGGPGQVACSALAEVAADTVVARSWRPAGTVSVRSAAGDPRLGPDRADREVLRTGRHFPAGRPSYQPGATRSGRDDLRHRALRRADGCGVRILPTLRVSRGRWATYVYTAPDRRSPATRSQRDAARV